MANIKKSFNFRNGVQVDDDNLKVSDTGLVGIGTTVPTEALDVRGNLVVSGVSSAVTAQAGVLTVTTLNPTEIIGAGVSIKSGIVTASSGIITYFGDGINLLNLPTSQWEDTIVGAGVSSIYNTGGNVGIATTAAIFTLQVGNDVNSGQKGVGISSFGDIKASGIATASRFVGPLTGDVTGNVTGSITGNVTGNITGNLTGNLTGLVNSAGISTFAGINATGRIVGAAVSNVIPFFYSNLSDLPSAVTYHGAFAHVHSTGKGYYAHGGAWIELVNKDTSGDVSITGDVDVTGGITATGVISGQQVSGTVSVNTATLNATNGTFASTGSLSAQGGISVKDLRIATGSNRTLITTPVGVATVTISGGDLKLQDKIFIDGTNPELRSEGNITLSQKGSNLAKIGVGTISPANDIQVRRFTGNAEIQVTADTGIAGISVGRETGTNNTNNGEFRYGGGSGFTFSSAQSLDIINYGTGNFNYHLSANNSGAVQGDFHWHKGSNNVRLMTLTNTGRLGIGVTQPTDELDVVGGVTVSGNVAVGNNITVSGNIIGNVQGTLTGNVAGTLAGNTNTTVGISTLNNLSVAGIATITKIRTNNFAIGENPGFVASDVVSIKTTDTNKIIINDLGQVGIAVTEHFPNISINAFTSNLIIGQIGVGVTQFNSGSVDFSSPGPANRRYVNLPRVSTALRGNLTGLISGAMIYNTQINKLQFYNGSGWETVTSS